MATQTAWEKIRSALGNLAEPEGLATGAVGGLLFGGPVGVALGIGQGILAKRMRQNELDARAAEQDMLNALDEQHMAALQSAQGVGATELDRAQLDQLGRDYKMLRVLAASPDEQTRQAAMTALAKFGPSVGAYLEDVESRNESVFDKNVSLLDEQADRAREEYRAGLNRGQETQRISQEMHTLLSDPDFDPNNPVNRARLASLLGQTPRELFADPADMGDALRETAAGVPIAQQVAAWISGKAKAEEFEFSKEDWRKVAHAMTLASKRQSDQMLNDAAAVGQRLDAAGQEIGHMPAISYLDRIVSGKVQPGPTVGEASIYQQNIADQKAREAEQRAQQKDVVDEYVKPSVNAVKDTVNEAVDAGASVIKNVAEETLGLFGIRRRKRQASDQAGATGSWRPTN
jgi:predicted lactoylglutathione lyase